MSEETFTARVRWQRTTPDFSYDTYDRGHDVVFGSGQAIRGSAAPSFKGAADRANPEELLVAALSSCHMLTFLAIAAKKRLVVDRYEDDAAGVLGKNEAGRLCVTAVTLRPKVSFKDHTATKEELTALHESAHRGCFIANSVTTTVTVDPLL